MSDDSVGDNLLEIAGPRTRTLELATRALRPLLWAISPRIDGFENIPPRGPVLFVGNHTLVFMADYTIMMLELYRRRAVTIWSVADHFHYGVPGWRDLLMANGAIDGTYENCKQVLEAGENLVVFPGGAREVTKRRGEKYKLIWGERKGFARLAIDAQATVVPFGAVGGDDIFDVMVDGDTIMKTPAGDQLDKIFERLGLTVDAYLPPVFKGVGPTFIPRFQRLYYQFGDPISPARFAGRVDDEDAVEEFRDDIADGVERAIQTALKAREDDDESTFVSRMSRRAGSLLDTFGIARSGSDAQARQG